MSQSNDETSQFDGADPRNRRLDEVVTAYLRAMEGGQTVDRNEWLTRYADLATDLSAFFADQDLIQRLAAPLAGPVGPADLSTQAETLSPHAGSPAGGPARRVRYFGDYELIAEIARGGMGVVYEAQQINLGRRVALKMILAGHLASPADVQRFYTEAQAAAGLDHPAIVPIYEIGMHGEQHYFSMAFIEGQSLAAKVSSGPLPPRESAQTTKRIAEAIAYAHGKGVIHRDLKPANILLDKGGEPKVTDFGLAKKVETESGLTHTGAILGTPSYMPPEQAAGKAVGPLADVYSLGAILYCLLTGRPPFQAASPLDTLLQVIGEDPVAPRQLNPKLPRDLETICLKCLQKDAGKRYSSASALVDDLGRYMRGEPIWARPTGSVERAWRWCRRNPVVSSLAIAVSLSLVIGTVVSTIFAIAANQQAIRANQEATRANEERQNAEAARRQAEENELKALRNLHLSSVIQAQQHANLGETAGMIAALESQIPQTAGQADFRGFEWHLLNRMARGYAHSLSGHTVSPKNIVYSPNGKYLATAGFEEVTVWDASAGKRLLTLSDDHGAYPYVGAPDASAGKGLLKLSEPQLGAKFGVQELTFTPDSNYLAVIDGGEASRMVHNEGETVGIRLFAIPSGTLAATIPGSDFIALSPDGTQVATLSSDSRETWASAEALRAADPAKAVWRQVVVRTFPAGELIRQISAHTQPIRHIAFSPDGKRLGVSGETDPTSALWDGTERHVTKGDQTGEGIWARIWDVETGQPLVAYEVGARVEPSETFIVPERERLIVRDKQLVVYDGAPGDAPPVPPKGTWAYAISPDGKTLAAGSWDTDVHIFDRVLGKPLRVLKGGAFCYVAFSPDGTRLATASWDRREDYAVKIWDPHREPVGPTFSIPTTISTPLQLVELPQANGLLAFEPLPKTRGFCQAWNLSTGQPLPGFEKFILDGDTVLNPATTLDGKTLVAEFRSPEGKIELRFCSTVTRRLLRTLSVDAKAFDRRSMGVAYSPGFETAVTAQFADETKALPTSQLVLWDLADGKTLRSWNTDVAWWVHPQKISPDGKLLACAAFPDSGGIRALLVYDVTSGKLLHQLSTDGLHSPVIAFSLDGRQLVAATSAGWRVWEPDTGRLLRSITIPGTQEGELRPDGPQAIATLSHDTTRLVTTNSAHGYGSSRLLLWDVASGQQLLNLPAPDGYGSLSFTADDRRLIISGYEEDRYYIRVWDGSDPERKERP